MTNNNNLQSEKGKKKKQKVYGQAGSDMGV